MYSGNGHWMLEMSKSVNLPRYDTWNYFHHHDIDLTILITFSVITAILIAIVNDCLLIKVLRKTYKVRVHKPFVILCFSDIGIVTFAMPVQSVLLFSRNLEIVCSLHKLMAFASSNAGNNSHCLVITRCR